MKYTTKELTLTALFAALIAVGAFIKLPISIVPVTLQTLFIFLVTFTTSRKVAVSSMIVYLAIGLAGVPIFASGGGFMYVLVPSFGYLIGFLVAVIVGSTLLKIKNNIYTRFLIGLLELGIIYAIGILYFIFIMNVHYGKTFDAPYILYNLFWVYIPGDIISLAVAAFASARLRFLNTSAA
ncbi:MAG: biotin transporter BioY [Lachnospiraceae bacterium]|nr:biotin transporter BioY [Lachnospiraceae bacterium]